MKGKATYLFPAGDKCCGVAIQARRGADCGFFPGAHMCFHNRRDRTYLPNAKRKPWR